MLSQKILKFLTEIKMIKKILLTILTFTLVTASVLYLQSCDIKSPTDGVYVLFNTPAPTTAGTIAFIDAKTLDLISSPNVTVSILGSNAGKITDFAGTVKTSFTSGGGIVAFGVDPNGFSSADSTITISVLASANGYLTTSIPITINKAPGCTSFNFYMVNIDNPPDGVSIMQTSNAGTVNNGVLNSESSLSTTLTNGTGGIAKIRLPAGTIITDNSPSPINLNGQLSATVAYFDPTKESALRCFPGGFTMGSNTMISAGFALYEIKDASGREAKRFPTTQPEITIEIPSNTNNFAQSRTIIAGDIIPIFSYENLVGTWTSESNGTVLTGGNSNFAIKFNTSHLSYWNLDFLTPGVNCPTGRKLVFNQTGGCSQIALQVKLYFVSGTTETYYKTITKSASDASIQLLYAPSSNMRIKLYYNNNTTPIYTSDVVSLCSGGDLALTYSIPNLNTITGTVVGICTNNPNVQVHPTLPVYYRRTGTPTWYYLGYMVNGSLTQYCGEYGTYDFMTYYNNSALFANSISITTTNPSFTFTLGNCQ